MFVYVTLLVGFFLLIKGADYFVDGSSSVAKLLRVPTIVIGLTVVAFGTSMPEASVSITAALAGKNDLAVSNVIGSNIFNLLVVLGASACVRPLQAKWSVLKKEFPYSIIITAVLLIAVVGLQVKNVVNPDAVFVLGRIGGAVLLLLFVLFLVSTVRDAMKARNDDAVREELPDEEYKVLGKGKSALYILVGMAGIIFGGDLVVNSATSIAEQFGMSQTFIGLTVVALGTSLPELVTSMVAAKKGENDLALGNVVGSNIFNILLILGASSTILPITVNVLAVYDMIVLIAASLIVYVSAVSKKGISRKEGILFLFIYAAYFVYILLR